MKIFRYTRGQCKYCDMGIPLNQIRHGHSIITWDNKKPKDIVTPCLNYIEDTPQEQTNNEQEFSKPDFFN